MSKNKSANDQVWVDDISGLQLNKANVREVSTFVGGYPIKIENQDAVVMPTPRGDLVVKQGDWVGRDQGNRWHLVRCTPVASENKPKPGPRK